MVGLGLLDINMQNEDEENSDGSDDESDGSDGDSDVSDGGGDASDSSGGDGGDGGVEAQHSEADSTSERDPSVYGESLSEVELLEFLNGLQPAIVSHSSSHLLLFANEVPIGTGEKT